jgi:hypothetical protein
MEIGGRCVGNNVVSRATVVSASRRERDGRAAYGPAPVAGDSNRRPDAPEFVTSERRIGPRPAGDSDRRSDAPEFVT